MTPEQKIEAEAIEMYPAPPEGKEYMYTEKYLLKRIGYIAGRSAGLEREKELIEAADNVMQVMNMPQNLSHDRYNTQFELFIERNEKWQRLKQFQPKIRGKEYWIDIINSMNFSYTWDNHFERWFHKNGEGSGLTTQQLFDKLTGLAIDKTKLK